MSIITDPLGVPSLDITSAKGVPFMVLADVDANLVEFWDLRHPGPHFNAEVHSRLGVPMPGQFVTRSSISTLTGEDTDLIDFNEWAGLILDGGVPDWTIDSAAMHLVRMWLRFTRSRAAFLA